MYNKRAGCFLQYLFFLCFVLMCWWWRYNKESVQSNHEIPISSGCIRRKSHPRCGSIFLEVLENAGAFRTAETCNTLQKSKEQKFSCKFRTSGFLHRLTILAVAGLNPYVPKQRQWISFCGMTVIQLCLKLFHVQMGTNNYKLLNDSFSFFFNNSLSDVNSWLVTFGFHLHNAIPGFPVPKFDLTEPSYELVKSQQWEDIPVRIKAKHSNERG